MTKRLSEFRKVPFVNSIGQTVNPGDSVVAIKSSWSRTKSEVCEFLGINVRNVNGSEIIVSVAVLNKNKSVWKYNYETGKGDYITRDIVSTLVRKRVVKIENGSINAADIVKYI